ncbi:hypothetical protein [Burkholderia gladioli]|uniref:hypothetical protein n=1 Tax=Burkholderia gladioli TaxID=28095 RepID=UPI00163FDB33|nr:hypothetical protein [Burkholderia gladioli]
MDANAAAVQQAYAAWVQAIGSIIAIGVAIYVPFRQRRDEMRVRELHYWSERADIERRIVSVAQDLWNLVQRVIEKTKPIPRSTLIYGYESALDLEVWERIAALEARDIGDDGHDRVAAMRQVVKDIRLEFFGSNSSRAFPPDSTFSADFAKGVTARKAKECLDRSTEALELARKNVTRLSIRSKL